MKQTTQELVKTLRSLMPLGPTLSGLISDAADRLEELQRECDEAFTEIRRLTKNLEDSTNHYNRIHDLLRAEVERLKQALHDARLENSGQAAQLERTRPEPSRLEIAAMIYSARTTNADLVNITQCFKEADALIAVAREEGK